MSGDVVVETPFTFLKLGPPKTIEWHLKKNDVENFFRKLDGRNSEAGHTLGVHATDSLVFQSNPCIEDYKNQAWRKNGKLYFQGLLNAIFKPNHWEEHGNILQRNASKKDLARPNIDCCRIRFDKFIRWKHVPSRGICVVRHTYYMDFFDEVIRQITIEQPIQGVLIKRMKDEIAMTIDNYRTTYDYLPLARFEGYENLLQESKQATFTKADEALEKYLPKLQAEIDELQRKRTNKKAQLERIIRCGDAEIEHKKQLCVAIADAAKTLINQYKAQIIFLRHPDISKLDVENILNPKETDDDEWTMPVRRSSSETEQEDKVDVMMTKFNNALAKQADKENPPGS